jgi:hypothetical protein
MASPLNYFRKHQGYILAVLGVILIVTWVIGPSVLNLFEPSPNASRDAGDANVVAQWKRGKITRSDLNRMGWEHQAVVRFLGAVIERATAAGGKPQAPFLRVEQNRVVDLGIPLSTSDRTLVHILFLAEKGRELGVQVDQQAVQDYLNNLGGFVLTDSDFRELAQESLAQFRDSLTKTQLVTVTQLYDRLSVELAARQAQEMFLSGLGGFSTGELWEYHGQLHRRFKIEAYPLDVAAYKGKFKASDAKEEELRKIYQEGKDRPPNPESHEPGFRQPRRIAFGYAKVDFAKFLEAAKKQIPEERIVEEYQKEITAGNFRKLKLPTSDAARPPDNKATAPPQDGEKPAEPKPPAGDSQPKQPPKADAGDSKEKAEGAKSPEKDAGKNAEPAKSAPESKESTPKDDKACQDEPAKNADDSQPKKKESAASDDAPPAAKGEQSGSDKPEAGDKPPAGEASDKTADDQTKSKADEPEFRPLSEVRDELLTRLAFPEAKAASDAAVKAVTREVQDYSVKYIRWTESKKAGGKTTVKDPGELRIKSLASKYNLLVGETPLADQFQIAITELGPHIGDAYFENRPLYAPLQAESFRDEGTFVYWRTQDQPSAEVPYEKARPQVVEVWIKQRAAEAARKEAEALAAKAATADSLKSALSADEAKKVVEPLPFSWLTVGGTPLAFGGMPRLSEVIGIPLAGNEFMEAVFSLEVGQSGVAINQPHTTVYVVRVVAEEPALDIRREMFLSSLQAGLFGDLARFAIMERQRMASEVIENLHKEYQLVWVESPRFDAEM